MESFYGDDNLSLHLETNFKFTYVLWSVENYTSLLKSHHSNLTCVHILILMFYGGMDIILIQDFLFLYLFKKKNIERNSDAKRYKTTFPCNISFHTERSDSGALIVYIHRTHGSPYSAGIWTDGRKTISIIHVIVRKSSMHTSSENLVGNFYQRNIFFAFCFV